jgi:hypothetical protein
VSRGDKIFSEHFQSINFQRFSILGIWALFSIVFLFEKPALSADNNTIRVGAMGGAISASDANFHPTVGAEVIVWDDWSARHLAWGYKRADYTIYGSQSSFAYSVNPTSSKLFSLRVGLAYGRYVTEYSGDDLNSSESSKRGNVSLTTGIGYKLAWKGVFCSAEIESYFTPAYGALLLAFGHQLFAGISIGAEL